MNELAKLRLRGLRQLVVFGQLCSAALLLLALVFDLRNEWLAVIFSLAMNVVPTFCAMRRRYDLATSAIFGINAAVQPALLVYLLQGHPVADGRPHVFLRRPRRAHLTVRLAADRSSGGWSLPAHHLLLGYVVPEWVFPGQRRPACACSSTCWRSRLGTGTCSGRSWCVRARLFVAQAEARAERSERSADFAFPRRWPRLRVAEGKRRSRATPSARPPNVFANARCPSRRAAGGIAAAFESSVANIVQSVHSCRRPAA